MKFSRRWQWLARLHPRRPAMRLIDRLAQPLDDVMQVLLRDTTEGVLIVDQHGLIVRANDRLREMLDTRVDIARARSAAMLFAAADRDEVEEELASVLAGRRQPRVFAARLEGEYGSDQSVDVSGAALREADGTVSGLILRLSDVTLRKQLEIQLAQSQKLQALGQLAGGIAHDFNNLLTAVIGASDLISARPIDAETREDVTQIRRSADRGAELVSQLLAFGRKQTLQPKPVAINGAIRDLSLLLRRVIDGRVKLELDLDPTERMVKVDPTQLDQVLLNLAVNARDAMPGGGELTLRSGHMTLYRALVRGEETIPPGRYVMIEVQDTGIGIPAEILPQIFDPFFTTRRDTGGSGLGLSTVHGIVRQSDGFLAVESEPGTGTRLRVYLPRHESSAGVAIPTPDARPPRRAEDAHPADPASLTALTALLVDDETSVRRLANRALVQAGWQVIEAESGEQALDLLRERADAGAPAVLDLLITDVVMPGMDGPALARQIRERYPDLPTILVSGYARDALPSDVAAEGVRFLPKPYTLKSLVAVAGAAVSGHDPPAHGQDFGPDQEEDQEENQGQEHHAPI